MIYYAIGTLVAWNALTAPQQAVYTAHYLTEEQLFDSIPATFTDNVTAELISAVPLASIVTPVSDFDGYSMVVDGKGFVSTVTNNYYFYSDTALGDLKYINMYWNRTVDAGANYQSYLIGVAGSGSRTFENCTYNGNGHVGQFIWDTGTSETRDYFIKKCLIMNVDGENAIRTRDNSPSSVFEHLVFYNCAVTGAALFFTTDGIARNLYIHVTSGTCYLATGSPTESDVLTSDATSPDVGDRNISPTDAMIDPVGGDYMPKKNGVLDVGAATTSITKYLNGSFVDPDHVYASCYGYGPAMKGGGMKKSRAREIAMRQIERMRNILT
ncbi:MAG: hypothetical protein V3V00_15630 [Saprospiraceae bacterium]